MTIGLSLRIAITAALAGLAAYNLVSGRLETAAAWAVAAVFVGMDLYQGLQSRGKSRVLVMMLPGGQQVTVDGVQPDGDIQAEESGHDHSLCQAKVVGKFVQAIEPLRQAAINQFESNRAAGLSPDTAEEMACAFYETGLNVLVKGGRGE